jgi:zinc D-Ala-D-Ala dipeptidase
MMTCSSLSRRVIVGGLLATPIMSCSKTERKVEGEGAVSTPTTATQKIFLDKLIEIKPDTAGLRLDLRYASTNNFTGRVLYSQARAFLQAVAATALGRAQAAAMADGYGLTIFDAYRPWRVTKQLWDATPRSQRNYVANPKRGSRHNRGCAIDLSLHLLETGALVEMPSAFDDFSQRAHRDFMGASENAIANRERLARYMEGEGFIGMSNEWWHFDYQDWRNFPVLDLPFEDL